MKMNDYYLPVRGRFAEPVPDDRPPFLRGTARGWRPIGELEARSERWRIVAAAVAVIVFLFVLLAFFAGFAAGARAAREAVVVQGMRGRHHVSFSDFGAR